MYKEYFCKDCLLYNIIFQHYTCPYISMFEKLFVFVVYFAYFNMQWITKSVLNTMKSVWSQL